MLYNQTGRQVFQLDTTRLRLRALGKADVEHIFQLYSYEEVARHLSRLPSPWSPGAAQDFVNDAQAALEQGAAYTIGMVQGETETFIGVMALRIPANDPSFSDAERAEDIGLGILGYSIAPPFWNRGYATEGAGRMIAFGFDELGLDRLQATVLRTNTASRRVIERFGFAIEEAGIWEEPLCGGVARLADCYVLRRIRE